MSAPASKGRFWVGLLLGVLAGTLASCFFGGVFAYSWGKRRSSEARRGWNLVPTVVAAVDLEVGTVVTFDHLSQRSFPEQFVNASIVTPDRASYIVNQPALAPVAAGDLMLWSAFESRGMDRECFDRVQAEVRSVANPSPGLTRLFSVTKIDAYNHRVPGVPPPESPESHAP